MKNRTLTPSLTTWAASPSILDTVGQFLYFLKRPRHRKRSAVPKENRLQVLSQLIITEVIVKALLVAAVGFVYYLLDITTHQLPLDSIMGNKPLYLVILLVAVYGPLKEEIIFRLPLVYSRRSVLIALAVFLAGYAPVVMQEASLGILHYTVVAVVLSGLAAIFLLSPQSHACIRQPWRKDYPSLFYIIALVSALQYLVNYPYLNLPIFILPVLVLIQWTEGLFLGYTRLHLGFKWCIAQHVFNKLLLLAVLFSFYSTT